jgi:glycosyltransferase involved in cell wall biosynthesis
LHAQGYDIVSLPGYQAGKVDYLSFLKLYRLLKIKEIDLVHSHSTDGLIDSALCRMFYLKVKAIHTFHFGNYPYLNKKYLLMEKIFSKVPNRLVAVGSEQKESIIKTFSIPKKRISTVWNGVEGQKKGMADSNLLESLPKGKLILGSISTFIPQKGLDYLLDIAVVLKQKRKDFIVLIVGDGPLRPDLEKRCNQLNLSDTVFFLGWLKDAPSRILPLFDIFVQSSLWEAMSMVILESMAEGKPIVATEVGENRHVIEHGESGFLSQPGDTQTMAGHIELLLDNAETRNSMGLKARESFESNFTVDLMARRYEQVYNEVLGR